LIIDGGVGASSILAGPFCVRTYGTSLAAGAYVRVLVLNAGTASSSVAKGTFSLATGGTASESPHDINLGLTLSTPAHHRQNRFQHGYEKTVLKWCRTGYYTTQTAMLVHCLQYNSIAWYSSSTKYSSET